jgi:DNA-binding response OmpR family regulator
MNLPQEASRALVVEDEPLLAMDVADQLADAGFEIVGPATSVASALNLLDEQGCDVAVLDVHLGAEDSEAVALALKSRGTPFVILSGNAQKHFPLGFQGAPFLSKPTVPSTLVALLRTLLDAAAQAHQRRE